MWNMKQPKRATMSHDACWPELDEFHQKAAHQLCTSWFSLPFYWPDLWFQCAALHLSNSCFFFFFWWIGDVSMPILLLQKGWKGFMQELRAIGVKLIFAHCCKLLNCILSFFSENDSWLYCFQTTGRVCDVSSESLGVEGLCPRSQIHLSLVARK